jgi:hypothetical protein
MPKITALLHCHGDPQRLARALETLRPFDEILIISHDAGDDVEKVARQHGAAIKVAVPGVSPGAYLVDAANDWIFCMKEGESLSDDLEASLLEWKQQEHQPSEAFAVGVRTQANGSWQSRGRHTRLVNRTSVNWIGELPPEEKGSDSLRGDVLEIESPGHSHS